MDKGNVNACYTALLLESIRDFCAHLHDHSGQYLMGLLLVENGAKQNGLERRKESWSEKDLSSMHSGANVEKGDKKVTSGTEIKQEKRSSNASAVFESPLSPRRK